MPNLDSVLTTLNTNTETNTAIHSSQFDSVGRIMGIYWRHYHVKNKELEHSSLVKLRNTGISTLYLAQLVNAQHKN